MKQHHLKLCLFALLAALCGTPAASASVKIGDLYYSLDSSTNTAGVTYMSYRSRDNKNYVSGDLVIPSTVDYNGATYSVTYIGNDAFYRCDGLTSVTIPNSVTEIGDNAFNSCSGLTSVHIEDLAAWCNIKFMYSSFSNPLSYAGHLYLNGQEVKDLIIPDSVTKIGRSAFDECSGLTSVTIPNSVTEIEYHAFRYCSGLTSVHIEDLAAWCKIKFKHKTANPLRYAYHLYLNGQEVKDLIIPDSVTTIGDYAFNCCYKLTSVTIPDSVTTIGDEAFYYCPNLTSVTIPNSVTEIGDGAFHICDGLTEIYCSPEIPPTITDDTFDDLHYNNATLYVPTDKLTDYELATGWCRFSNIRPHNFSGIEDITAEGDADGVEIVGYYNTHGVRADEPWPGINIAVYSDGSRRKLVK